MTASRICYLVSMVNFICAFTKIGTLAPRSSLCSKKYYLSIEQSAQYFCVQIKARAEFRSKKLIIVYGIHNQGLKH